MYMFYCMIILISFLFIYSLIISKREKKEFNNGNCLKCNQPLFLEEFDGLGGRLYKCHKCGYHVWVDNPKIDKDYLEE